MLSKNLSIPLIVGGGIRTPDQLEHIFKAGADVAVIGTAIENNLEILKEMAGIAVRTNG
jgi:putative glycerol-1-phosphate prenyltransferase